MRMEAYYYSFAPTGVEAIDRILSAVANAGKAFHHTESWTEVDAGPRDGLRGESPVEWIQNAANDAAKALSLPSPPAQATAEGHSLSPADSTTGSGLFPVPLSETQEAVIKQWAADDRLWTTQETVEFNLRVFARKIITSESAPSPLTARVTARLTDEVLFAAAERAWGSADDHMPTDMPKFRAAILAALKPELQDAERELKIMRQRFEEADGAHGLAEEHVARLQAERGKNK